MMARPVRVSPRAQNHLSEAYQWYEQRREGLGAEFLDAVEECVARIGENPGQYPTHHDRIRRALAERFPYLIFYVVDPDECVVIAVLHASRDPQQWP